MRKLLPKLFNALNAISKSLLNQEIDRHVTAFLTSMTWSVLTFFVCSGLTFSTGIFAARLLGPESFGHISLLLVTSQFVQFLLLFGFDSASIHAVIKSENESDKKGNIWAPIYFLIITSTALSLVLLIAYSILVRFLVVDLAYIFAFAGLTISFSFKLLLDSLIRSLGFFRRQFIGRFAEALFVIVTFFMIYFGAHYAGYYSYIFSLILGASACSLFYIYSLSPYFSALDKSKLFDQLRHGYVFIQGSISASSIVFIDRSIVAKFMGIGDLGLLSAYINSSSTLSGQIGQTIVNVFFPFAIRIRDRKKLVDLINRVASLVLLPAIAAFFVIMAILIKILGQSYQLKYSILFLFALLAAFQLINTIYTYLIGAFSRRMYEKYVRFYLGANILGFGVYALLIAYNLFSIQFIVLVYLCVLGAAIVSQNHLIRNFKD